MKKIIRHILLLLGVAVGLSSCDKVEGTLYTPDAEKASFLATTGNFVMANGVVEVPVDRPANTTAFSFPVKLGVAKTDSAYLKVFSANDPVTFAAGESKTTVKIKYTDFSSLNPSTLAITPSGLDVKAGLAFPLELTIEPKYIAPRDIQKISVLASQTLEFEDYGAATVDSRDGWDEKIKTNVKVQKAKGANVYKVVSPFGANSIAFMVKADGKTITFPKQQITTNPTYGAVSMSNVTGTITGKVVRLVVGAYTIPDGRSFGDGVEIITLP